MGVWEKGRTVLTGINRVKDYFISIIFSKASSGMSSPVSRMAKAEYLPAI
jgi:hypothetical protein